jgi:hypothetical protein
MDKELHKNFSSVVAKMNNELTQIRKEEKKEFEPGDIPLSPAYHKGQYRQLEKDFKKLKEDVLEEIKYSFTGDNLPETTHTVKMYIDVIMQSYDVVCFNFQTTTLKPENRDHLGAWYAALLTKENAEQAKQQQDHNYNPKRRTADEMALVFAFELDELRKRINNKIYTFEQSINTTAKSEDEAEQPETPLPEKLIWLGTPGQFAFIMDLLINKGYIKKPTRFSERSAELLLKLFEFADHKPTKQSLGKLLHKNTDPITNIEHKGKFMKIPNRNDLDR